MSRATEIMENAVPTSAKRPHSLVQESTDAQEPPAKAPRRLQLKPRKQKPRTIHNRLVSRGCQTQSPVCMRLPLACNTTLPIPWGVQMRPAGKPVSDEEDCKENQGDAMKKDLAELLGGSSMNKGLAFLLGLRVYCDDDDADEEQELWNPTPPPEMYEGVEVARENRKTRSVATNTTHIRLAYPRHLKKSRAKQWRRAAKTWRL
ncbi:hypothetical protein E2C01_088693 [Portunus trituberculatus]|uniref:Uncharacterized protein n=1 Tax=Portunus trituberculatus TaxID=210409 RepID=A0A5B7J9Z8_PORTR|nr:hypothetical protein [Portunus trituberculatus]